MLLSGYHVVLKKNVPFLLFSCSVIDFQEEILDAGTLRRGIFDGIRWEKARLVADRKSVV